MKYLFSVITCFLLACSNGDDKTPVINDLTRSSAQLSKAISEQSCDTLAPMIVLKDILTNRRFELIKTKTSGINEIIWLNKFSNFDPEQSDPSDSAVSNDNFNDVFSQDFTIGLNSISCPLNLTNDQFTQRLNNLNSKVFFNQKVTYSLEVKVEGNLIEVIIDYIFPQSDEELDPNTVLIYRFRIDGCLVIIEDAMMIG